MHHSARINVFGKPVVRKMSNVTAVAGEGIAITCPVGGYPIDIISWERGKSLGLGPSRVYQFAIDLSMLSIHTLPPTEQKVSVCRTTIGRKCSPTAH